MDNLTFPQMQYVALSWLSVFLALIGIFIVFREYRKLKARPLVYLGLILIFLIPYNVCHGLMFLVGFERADLMILLFRIQMLFLFIVVFFLIFFISVSSYTIQPLII